MTDRILSIFPPMHASDCVDILIVSILLFMLSRIVQKNVHRRVWFAALLVAVFYLVARRQHWELTLLFIKVISIATGVGMLLVFQEDIRRLFESFIFFDSKKTSYGKKFEMVIRTLLEATDQFGRNRIGALIVIQQKVPVAHLIRGGQRLNGEVSVPLLSSLFDPHSAGHDGAVVLNGTQVARFGAHLPLSRKLSSTGRAGTRHTAALGLAEISDAIIIVVSEETGELSIAEAGQIRKVTGDELELRLKSLRTVDSPAPQANQIQEYFRRNWLFQTACAAAAFLLWVGFAAPRNLQQRTLALNVTLEDIPKDHLVEDPMPTECKVTLTGSQDVFDRWQRENQLIKVPVRGINPGVQKIALSSTNLNLPAGLHAHHFDPSSVTLKVHKGKWITVPVVVNNVNGRSPTSKLARIRVTPPTAKILVPENDPGPTMVATEPVDSTKIQKGNTFDLRLVPPIRAQFFEQTPSTVRVVID